MNEETAATCKWTTRSCFWGPVTATKKRGRERNLSLRIPPLPCPPLLSFARSTSPPPPASLLPSSSESSVDESRESGGERASEVGNEMEREPAYFRPEEVNVKRKTIPAIITTGKVLWRAFWWMTGRGFGWKIGDKESWISRVGMRGMGKNIQRQRDCAQICLSTDWCITDILTADSHPGFTHTHTHTLANFPLSPSSHQKPSCHRHIC